MPKSTPTNPSTPADAGQPGGAASEPCPPDCTRRTYDPREVDERVSETISNAPSSPTDYSAWNGRFSWDSKFTVSIDRPNCTITATIKIRVTGRASDEEKAAWKSAIEAKWSGKVRFVCPDPECTAACPDGYAVNIEVRYVRSRSHYRVRANAATATEGGRAGIGGTTSMTGWGIGDTTDVCHEFGHMLGNVEEYFTTDGVDYTAGGTKDGFRDPDGGIMNNPANDPLPRNYELIRRNAAALLGVTCTTRAA